MVGDLTVPPWRDVSTEMQTIVISGVSATLTDPDPAASHARWLARMREEGWTYGTEKNEETKTHPCVVSYADLPEWQRRKNDLFVSMVQELGLVSGIIRIVNEDSKT